MSLGTQIFSNSQLFSIDIHRIDVILPGKQNFSIPLVNRALGKDIIILIKKERIQHFVICRNSQSEPSYELIYVDDQNSPLQKNVKIPFETTMLSSIFVPNRNITTRHQRMTLFVFYHNHYYDLISVWQQCSISGMKNNDMFRKVDKFFIKVRLPTNLVISLKIKMNEKIADIQSMIYNKMVEIYNNAELKSEKDYRFGTIYSYYPPSQSTFQDEKQLVDALKKQKVNPTYPEFIYIQTFKPSAFNKASAEYTCNLELSTIPYSEESRSLDCKLSKLRSEIEKQRIEKLRSNPLLARMRISDCEPTLPMSYENIKGSASQLSLKLDLRPANLPGVSVTTLSLRVGLKTHATEAIRQFLKRLQRILNKQNMMGASEFGTTNSVSATPSSSFNTMTSINSINSINMPSNNELSNFSTFNGSFQKTDNSSLTNRNSFNDTSNGQQSGVRSFSFDQSESGIFQSSGNSLPRSFECNGPLTSEMKFNNQNSDSSGGGSGNDGRQKRMSSEGESEGFDGPLDFNENDFVLVLTGMDEVLAGDTPLMHFVSVRQFILSQQPALNLLLVQKREIVESIQKKELNVKEVAFEPSSDADISIISINSDSKPTFGFTPHSILMTSLDIYVHGCIDIPNKKNRDEEYVFKVSLINGTATMCKPVLTNVAVGKTNIIFDKLCSLPMPIKIIPRTARVAFTLYDAKLLAKNDKNAAISTFNFPVYTFSGWMNTGRFVKRMWADHDTDYFLTTCESTDPTAMKIIFNFPRFKFPVAFLPPKPKTEFRIRGTLSVSPPEKARLDDLKNNDPLYELTQDDKQILYRCRTYCFQFSDLLPLMLSSINFREPDQVNEIPLLLGNWERPSPTVALTLLNAKFADLDIRAYAVSCIEAFTDSEIMLYMLQLVQALKFELYDDSPLAIFLFKRGLAEPKFLGHQLFWQLMSEAHLSHIRQRFSALLVNFIYGLGSYREELIKGYKFTQELVKLNQRLGHLKFNEATEPFREALKTVEVPKEFHLPINPRIVVDSFVIEKCKVMNSKKKPFWLTFKNASPFATDDVMTMFKVGDDLRQDQLTLQVMKVMEHLWRTNDQDFQLRCYGVLPTGYNQGFIEVVPNSMTESQLQQEKGILSGVLTKETFTNFLHAYNQTPSAYEKARINFRKSSAGYAVATCVLGIADRHPGNIMVQQDGHFFHIDFGHFLGNFKTKLGYQRENAPFHFSPAMAFTLDDGGGGGEAFKLFETEAAFALNVLRHNANLLITLFLLMLGTGIPELSTPADIDYLKQRLLLDKKDHEAAAEFSKLTKISMESTKTMLNNFFHNLKA